MSAEQEEGACGCIDAGSIPLKPLTRPQTLNLSQRRAGATVQRVRHLPCTRPPGFSPWTPTCCPKQNSISESEPDERRAGGGGAGVKGLGVWAGGAATGRNAESK